MASKGYEVPWWAYVLNSFPHLDLTFQRVNSSFDLDDPKYKESLMFWAAAPVVWLLITLLVFLMYFCYRCCQQESEKGQNVSCLKWTMAILTLFCCGAIGIGFYGNEEANKGISHLSEATDDAMLAIARMKTQAYIMQHAFNYSISDGINGIKTIYRSHVELNHSLRLELHAFTEHALQYAKDIFSRVMDINREARWIDLVDLVRDVKEYSFYRRLGMSIILGWLMLLCLILLVGIGNSSKCTLLLFCAFGIFSLVLCWMSTGLHLGTSVGVGDFCVAPHHYFKQLSSRQMDPDVVHYYTHCSSIIPKLLKDPINSASMNVKKSNKSLNDALFLAYKFINKTKLSPYVNKVYDGLDTTTEALLSLTALVDCTYLHKDYIDALYSICYIALPGILYLILSASITGLLFSILVVLASKAWRNVGSNSDRAAEAYIRMESMTPATLDEVNLCHLPNEERPVSHYSFPRGRHMVHVDRDSSAVQRRSTPPPAYNSNEFYRQYSDVNPPEDYCSRESNA